MHYGGNIWHRNMYRSPTLSVAPQSTRTPGLRPMAAGDVKQVTALLLKYLSQFNLRPVMGEEEVRHWFLPQENIIDTYVVEVQCVYVIHKAERSFCLV